MHFQLSSTHSEKSAMKAHDEEASVTHDDKVSRDTATRLLIETDNMKYPYSAAYTHFVKKSINCNNFDSLYLQNVFSHSYNINHHNNYNNCLPLILGGGGVENTRSLFTSMECCVTNISKYTEQQLQSISFDQKSINLVLNNNNNNNKLISKFTKLKNNDLKRIGLNDRFNSLKTIFIENDSKYGNCIIVIESCIIRFETNDTLYHIYSIDCDKWIVKEKVIDIGTMDSQDSRSVPQLLVFDQKLLIIAFYHDLLFYDITNLINLRFIAQYPLPFKDKNTRPDDNYNYCYFTDFAMICQSKTKKQINILLIGGMSHCPFYKSFFDVTITFEKKQIGCNDNAMDMDIGGINKNNFNKYISIDWKNIKIKCDNDRLLGMKHGFSNFGYQTIVNAKNERIAVFIGADVENVSKSILLYNCMTNELFFMENVLPYRCMDQASVLVHNDHMHVIAYTKHFLIDLVLLLKKFGMKYKSIDTILFWKQERLIWIAFHKNKMNQNNCMFAKDSFSKDLVWHVLSFLKYFW